MRRKINIGTTSLILIFIVLCLSTFGLLSLSNAKGDWNLAKKNANAVEAYYKADAQGEAFVQIVDRVLQDAVEQGLAGENRVNALMAGLGGYYQDDGSVQTDIEMDFGQALHIELEINEDATYQIRCWNVYHTEEYEIDDSIPVWTGDIACTKGMERRG